MSPSDDRELLIEETAGAYRPLRGGRVGSLAAWHDLDEAGRREAHARAAELRCMEAAMDPEGLSSTARAVLARINAGAGPS